MNKRSIVAISLCVGSMFATPTAQAASPQDIERVRQLITRGNSLMVKRQFQAAIDQYEEALHYDPGNVIAKLNIAETHNNWGIQYFSQHRFKDAIDEWDKCLKINPKHQKAKRNIEIAIRAAADQGVDVYGDESHGGASSEDESLLPDPRQDPQKGKGGDTVVGGVQDQFSAGDSPAEPADVRSPASRPKEPAPPSAGGKAQMPVEAPPSDTGISGAAMIIQPGTRTGADGSPLSAPVAGSNASAPSPGAPPPSSAPAFAVAPVVSPPAPPPGTPAATGSQPVAPLNFRNPTYPVAPPQFVNTVPPATAVPPAATAVPPATSLPPPAVPTMPDSVAAPLSTGSSVSDQLGLIEIKFSGQAQPDLTVLQRLERLEQATFGKPQSGTVLERVQALRHSYGL